MVDLDKHDDLNPTFGELLRRVERLEKLNDTFSIEFSKLKLEVSHLSLGFGAIKWLSLSILGTGFTVLATLFIDGIIK